MKLCHVFFLSSSNSGEGRKQVLYSSTPFLLQAPVKLLSTRTSTPSVTTTRRPQNAANTP
jgi:hypothetical protein